MPDRIVDALTAHPTHVYPHTLAGVTGFVADCVGDGCPWEVYAPTAEDIAYGEAARHQADKVREALATVVDIPVKLGSCCVNVGKPECACVVKTNWGKWQAELSPQQIAGIFWANGRETAYPRDPA